MPDQIQVDVRRTGRRFEAEAVLDLAADREAVWDTITDYPALPRFMPGIRACSVVERQTGADGRETLVVDQQGQFRFLLFAQSMTVRLAITHEPLHLTQARATRFALGLLSRRAIEVFEGCYLLSAAPARGRTPRTLLRYTALIGLALPPPPAIGTVAVRQNLTEQLEAVAREAERRAAVGLAAASARRR